jgi:hypothetical protein
MQLSEHSSETGRMPFFLKLPNVKLDTASSAALINRTIYLVDNDRAIPEQIRRRVSNVHEIAEHPPIPRLDNIGFINRDISACSGSIQIGHRQSLRLFKCEYAHNLRRTSGGNDDFESTVLENIRRQSRLSIDEKHGAISIYRIESVTWLGT